MRTHLSPCSEDFNKKIMEDKEIPGAKHTGHSAQMPPVHTVSIQGFATIEKA